MHTPAMHTTATRIGWAITAAMTAAMAVPALIVAAPAAARPGPDVPQAPPQSCSEANVSGGTASYIPVAGDPTAYQKCGPAGPVATPGRLTGRTEGAGGTCSPAPSVHHGAPVAPGITPGGRPPLRS